MPPVTRMRTVLLALAVAALAVLGACGGGDDEGASPATTEPVAGGPAAATVRADDLRFVPSRVRVRAGEVVRWEFVDGTIPHNVKGAFGQSPTMAKGRWDHTFAEPGRFPYVCTLHPTMRGTVEVT